MSELNFLALIVGLTSIIVLIHKRFNKIQSLPLILILYISFMILGNLELWDTNNQAIKMVQTRTISNLLPAMIFLMMLGFNVTLFKQLGRKMLVAFFATTLSLIIAFISIFYLFEPLGFEESAKSLATLAGSWSGGSINMVAVGKSIGISDTAMGNTVIVDTILYTFWLMFLLLLVPFASRFNRYTKAKVERLTLDLSCCINTDIKSYFRIILISILIAYGVNILAFLLPATSFMSPTFYAVILATGLGLIGSKTILAKLPAQSVANSMLYLIIALIASKAYLTNFSMTLNFLALALGVLLMHALLMFFAAKLFKLDLFSIGVASLAHIGGTAGATILASSYNKNLIPIAVVMATGGYLLGTFVGLFIAFLLGVS